MVHLLSDAVLVLPGGIDVAAVLLGQLSSQALELGSKPCAVLDPAGLFDPLAAQLAALEQAGELSAPLLREADPVRLADRLAAWRPAGQDAVRDEVAWMRVEAGSLSLLPLPDGTGLALPGGACEPEQSGRVALSQWLAEHCSLRLRPERFQLVSVLAVGGTGGVLRRVSCYWLAGSAPPLPGAVSHRVGDGHGCDPVAAGLQDLLLHGAVAL